MPISRQRTSLGFLWGAGVAAFSGSFFLLIWFLPGAIPAEHTSGVWAALAHDFSNGILYRPLFDGQGYGGTRYMPLFFVIYGVFITLFNDPVWTGFFLSLFSALLLDAGCFFLLRESGLKATLALPFTLLAHASIAYQLLTLTVKGDFLAAALNVWGIYFALRHLRKSSWFYLTLSSFAFLGAFMTKLTTVGGFAAVALYFIIRKRNQSLLFLTAATGSLAAILLLVIDLYSHGNAIASFQACALGAINFGYAIRTPLWFIRIIVQDPFFLIIFILTIFLFIKSVSSHWRTFPYLYFGITLISTLIIFSSPGTDHNHLIDLLFSCIWILGLQFTGAEGFSRFYNFTFGILISALVISWLPGTPSIKDIMGPLGKPTRETFQYIAQRLGPNAKHMLSENPLLPIMLGQRPIVMDPFSLRVLAQKFPAIQKDFTRKIKNQFFGAVVLLDYSGAPLDRLQEAMQKHTSLGVDRFYGEVHFPPGFLELLKSHYVLSFVKRPYVVFEPRKTGGPKGS
ncbi:MAG: hypothetical protein ACE5E9_04985 [Nitrospinaceae bacterium]